MALYAIMVYWFGENALIKDFPDGPFIGEQMIDVMDYYTANARISPFDPHVSTPDDIINTLWDDVIGRWDVG